MKTLELGYIHINDIIIGSESKIENGVLYVDEAAVKALVLILGALGMANMWEAVFADVGVSVIAILNSMRALKIDKD